MAGREPPGIVELAISNAECAGDSPGPPQEAVLRVRDIHGIRCGPSLGQVRADEPAERLVEGERLREPSAVVILVRIHETVIDSEARPTAQVAAECVGSDRDNELASVALLPPGAQRSGLL